ncbi:MAG: hypothetical protein HZB19_21830 [Chloroflexi bacterium]|nr:hypothetical protein [Chloroflexota bacterium]
MKTKKSLIKFAVYVLLITTMIFGVNIASVVIYDYKVLVDGILGIAVLYLAYRTFMSSKKSEIKEMSLTDALLEFPRNIKIFIFAFFWSLVAYWAAKHLIIMVLFFVEAGR